MGLTSLGWQTLAAVFCLYVSGLAVYRLYLSPISKFPGPKLAAVTLWYEFYYDVIKTGTYMAEIKKMHEKYGPIIRISPHELHVNDPDFYEELYAGGERRRNKYPWFVRLFGMTQGSLATIDHDHHRLRRNAINPFFSKTNVRKLEPVIQSNVSKLMTRLEKLEDTGELVNLNIVFSAFTSDIIIEYAFGESQHYLDKEDFNLDFFFMIDSIHHIGAAAKQFGWLLPVVLSIPEFIITRVDRGMAAFAKMQKKIGLIISETKTGNHKEKSIATIFHDVLSSNLPDSEKSPDRLYQEGQTFIAAGTETTAWCLTVITFYLFSNPSIMSMLRAELKEAKASSGVELEKLPYLSAVIQEGLRLSFGVCARLPRIAPVESLVLRDGEMVWRIPPNTPVSMSAGIQHLDPRIFPSPLEFQPSRWLNNKGLERYLVSFTKGSRQCAGINLAYAELYLCLNALFGRYGAESMDSVAKLRLWETGKEDVELNHDLFIPGIKKGSKGVRVVFGM
ncbi:putative cytochrome P450 [Leptodontidium sp. MPI-SDFR-AT-0119]|nr:putative cytochrome P450 [Leptodontidium sp. MPI-SDFR-AT-0119]